MTVCYNTNWMGPINSEWVAQYGEGWCAGRIDVRDYSETGYGGCYEYSLPPMHGEDWNLFSDWLDDLETDEVWEYKRLIRTFQDTVLNGTDIRWCEE